MERWLSSGWFTRISWVGAFVRIHMSLHLTAQPILDMYDLYNEQISQWTWKRGISNYDVLPPPTSISSMCHSILIFQKLRCNLHPSMANSDTTYYFIIISILCNTMIFDIYTVCIIVSHNGNKKSPYILAQQSLQEYPASSPFSSDG